MKLGTENRKTVIAAAAALILVAVMLITSFSGLVSSRPAAPQLTTVAADIPPDRLAQRSASGDLRGGRKEHTTQSLDPPSRSDLLRSNELTKSEGRGRNISKVSVEAPKAQEVLARPVTPQSQPSYVPALPPSIPLKYSGYGIPLGGAQRIFLMNGDDLFIAKEGDIVDGRYKVVRISPTEVDILDVLSNQQLSIPLTQG